MASLGGRAFPVPGYPRWIADAVLTPRPATPGGIVAVEVRVRVKRPRLMLAWALLTGKARLTR